MTPSRMIDGLFSCCRGPGIRILTLSCFVFLVVATGTAQADNDFNYICTATPYESGKKITATATPMTGGDPSGPAVNATVQAPGSKYYLISFKLDRGREYAIVYKVNGTKIHTETEVTPPSSKPYLRLREMALDPFKVNNGPPGYVLLRAKTENYNFDDSRLPDPKITSQGGKFQRATGNPGKGNFILYVKSGYEYEIEYNIGGKRYSKKDLVAKDSIPPLWILKDMGSNQPPTCKYTYGPWETCVDGHMKRQVIMSPSGCAQTTPPVLDTICRGAPDPVPDPVPPTPVGCTAWGSPVWGKCINNVQHGTISGIPRGCGSRDTTRACTVAENQIPRLNMEEDLERDTCETLAALTWEYYPVMEAKKAYTVTIRISESALRKLQAEQSKEFDLKKMKAGEKKEVGEEIYISDEISMELSSDRGEAFTITRQGSADPKPYRGRTLEFRWSVTPTQELEDAEFIAIPTMTNCADGKPEERASRTSRVSVTVSIGTKIDELVDTGTGTLTKIGLLLAAIGGVLGYFKGWFGGLFKKKEKTEGESTS